MNNISKIFIGLIGLNFSFGGANAQLSFDFSDIDEVPGSATTYSTAGDQWRANNVETIDGDILYAIFTIFETSVGSSTGDIRFINDESEGQDLRMRFDNRDGTISTPMWAKVNVMFYDTATDDEFVFTAGDTILTQFDDLDSDATFDRSDFGGIRQGDYGSVSLNSPTNLVTDNSIGSGDAEGDFTYGILDTPWGPEGNETSTDPVDQAPYTVQFDTTLGTGTFSFDFIMGYDSGGISTVSGNRHIDMDMTGILIPEPGTLLMAGIFLCSFGGLHLLKRRGN